MFTPETKMKKIYHALDPNTVYCIWNITDISGFCCCHGYITKVWKTENRLNDLVAKNRGYVKHPFASAKTLAVVQYTINILVSSTEYWTFIRILNVLGSSENFRIHYPWPCFLIIKLSTSRQRCTWIPWFERLRESECGLSLISTNCLTYLKRVEASRRERESVKEKFLRSAHGRTDAIGYITSPRFRLLLHSELYRIE